MAKDRKTPAESELIDAALAWNEISPWLSSAEIAAAAHRLHKAADAVVVERRRKKPAGMEADR